MHKLNGTKYILIPKLHVLPSSKIDLISVFIVVFISEFIGTGFMICQRAHGRGTSSTQEHFSLI